jgi:acyl-CoA thioesterase-1
MPFILAADRRGVRRPQYGYPMSNVHSALDRRAVLALLAALAAPFPANAAPDRLKLVALGDSLTAGLGLPISQAFPTLLADALNKAGENVEIANAGVSGDTATGGLARLDWAVPEGTQGVMVELGSNDMLRGVAPNVTRDALTQIVSRLRQRNLPVLIVGMMAAPGLGADYSRAFNAIFPDLAQQFGATLYPFFFEGLNGDTSLLQRDGMHPARGGVEKIVAAMLPTVKSWIEGIRAGG